MHHLWKVLCLGLAAFTFAGCTFALPSAGKQPPLPVGDDALAEHVPGEVLAGLEPGTVPELVAGAIRGGLFQVRGGLARIELSPGMSVHRHRP